MLPKILLALSLLAFLFVLFFPGIVPALLRRFGRSLRDAGKAGHEILTGEEVKNSPLARYEVRAGEMVVLKVLAEHPVVADPEIQKSVASVGELLAKHAMRKEIPYRFSVVESNEPNAFAVAGGSVFVTRPLIDLCAGDRGCLAGVLGHEIVHIDQRHALRSLARSVAVKGGIRLLSFGRGAVLGQLATGMQQLLVQGYRQEQELEADAYGSRIARLAGFDPQGLIVLLQRLQARKPEGKGVIADITGYFKSHPPIRTRIDHLRGELRT